MIINNTVINSHIVCNKWKCKNSQSTPSHRHCCRNVCVATMPEKRTIQTFRNHKLAQFTSAQNTFPPSVNTTFLFGSENNKVQTAFRLRLERAKLSEFVNQNFGLRGPEFSCDKKIFYLLYLLLVIRLGMVRTSFDNYDLYPSLVT